MRKRKLKWLQRNKPIPKMSKKRKRENAIYLDLRLIFLHKHPWCAVFPDKRSKDIHHIRGRAGTLFLDTRYWLAVSREGHHYIDNHPEESRSKGWLCQRGDWGRQGIGPIPDIEHIGEELLTDNRGWDGSEGTI